MVCMIPLALAGQLPEMYEFEFINNGTFRFMNDTIYPQSKLTIVGDTRITGTVESSSPVKINETLKILGVDVGTTLTDTVFTGSGIDDFVKYGDYTGIDDSYFIFEIDGAETFQWSNDSGVSWNSTDLPVTNYTTPLHIENGIYVLWNSDSGHTVGDKWEFNATIVTTPNLFEAEKEDGTNVCTIDYDGNFTTPGYVNSSTGLFQNGIAVCLANGTNCQINDSTMNNGSFILNNTDNNYEVIMQNFTIRSPGNEDFSAYHEGGYPGFFGRYGDFFLGISGDETTYFNYYNGENVWIGWGSNEQNTTAYGNLTATKGLYQGGVRVCLENGSGCNIIYTDLDSLINLSMDTVNDSNGNWSQDRVNYINDTTINNGSFILNNTDNDYGIIADNVTSAYVNNVNFTEISVDGNIVTWEIIII